MSRWGVGPLFVLLSLAYGTFMAAISLYFYPLLQIPFIQMSLSLTAGVVLISIGIPFFIISAVTVMKAYNENRLITGGVYRFCRHPLYSSWVVFIVPGMVILLNSWPGLTVPFFMFITASMMVKREEVYLEKIYGSRYSEYKKRVPSILPAGCIKDICNKMFN